MCLVDDDSEVAVTHVLDGIADKRKLLYRGDDDALATLDGIFQVAATVGMGDDFWVCPNARMLAVICLSRSLRSVTTMAELKSFSSKPLARLAAMVVGQALMTWKASHVSELLLPEPAECWMR